MRADESNERRWAGALLPALYWQRRSQEGLGSWMRSRSRSALLGVATVAIFTGCTTIETPAVRQERGQRAAQSINLQGFPPEYQKAFADGCAALGVANAKPPAGTALEVQGWRDGLRHCTNRK